jgi:hypothetical protein
MHAKMYAVSRRGVPGLIVTIISASYDARQNRAGGAEELQRRVFTLGHGAIVAFGYGALWVVKVFAVPLGFVAVVKQAYGFGKVRGCAYNRALCDVRRFLVGRDGDILSSG